MGCSTLRLEVHFGNEIDALTRGGGRDTTEHKTTNENGFELGTVL